LIYYIIKLVKKTYLTGKSVPQAMFILPGEILYSSKIKFKPRQRRLAVLKYSLRLVS